MTDIRTHLADAVKGHYWYFVGNLGVPGMPDRKGYKCPCGWSGDGDSDPHGHVADVLLAVPGIAIVDLEHVDKIAEAIARNWPDTYGKSWPWEGIPERDKQAYREMARAAVLAAASGVEAGQ